MPPRNIVAGVVRATLRDIAHSAPLPYWRRAQFQRTVRPRPHPRDAGKVGRFEGQPKWNRQRVVDSAVHVHEAGIVEHLVAGETAIGRAVGAAIVGAVGRGIVG